MNDALLMAVAVICALVAIGALFLVRGSPVGSPRRFVVEKLLSPACGVAVLGLVILWVVRAFF